METHFDNLLNGIVLAELAGYSHGPFCAKHGTGADIVILGTYIIDQSDNIPYPPEFVFKPDRSHYDQYFKDHVKIARSNGAKVCVSSLSVSLQKTLDSFIAAQEADADYVSLCAYSKMEMFTNAGLGIRMCHSDNRAELKTWISEILAAVKIPLIFKLGVIDEPDAFETVSIISDMGVPVIHAVTESSPESEGLAILKSLAKECRFLIGGGGVHDFQSAQRILATGASAVSIGRAAMTNPTFLAKLRSELTVQT